MTSGEATLILVEAGVAWRWTFSRLPLLDACVGPAVLPWVERETAASSSGSWLHSFLRNIRVLGHDDAVDLVPPEWREAAEAWDVSGLPTDPKAYVGETVFAVDLERRESRELAREVTERKPYAELGARPGEVAGAADAWFLRGSAALGVGDLKTGWAWVPPPRDNMQIRGLFAAAALATGREDGEGLIWHRRLDSSGWTERDRFDGFDVAETLDHIDAMRVRAALALVDLRAGRDLRLREGPWCKHCPAHWKCPAKDALGRALVTQAPRPKSLELEDIAEMFRGTLVDNEARLEAYHKLRSIDAYRDRLWEIFDENAHQFPTDLGNGRMYGPHETRRESYDGNALWQVAKMLRGEKEAWDFVEVKTTKSKGEDLARKMAAQTKATIKSELATIRTMLEERRGIRAKTTTSVTEYTVRKALGDGDE